MEPLLATGLPHYRAIVALDIERSTSRPDPVKAELRNKTYELFDAALGARDGYRERDRQDAQQAEGKISRPDGGHHRRAGRQVTEQAERAANITTQHEGKRPDATSGVVPRLAAGTAGQRTIQFRRLRIRWEIRDDIHEAFLSLA